MGGGYAQRGATFLGAVVLVGDIYPFAVGRRKGLDGFSSSLAGGMFSSANGM